MAANFGPDTGSDLTGPLRVKARPPNSRTNRAQLKDHAIGSCPRVFSELFEDFNGRLQVSDYYVPLIAASGLNDVPTTTASTAELRVPHAGQILSIDLIFQTSLAIDGTNYVRITSTNLQGAGAGSTAVASSATTVNTTFTAGAAITAGVPYALTLSATAANLYVSPGDVVQVTATPTGTLGALLAAPIARIRVQELPKEWAGRTSRTGAGGFVGVQSNTANGVVQGILAATSEAQTYGIDLGDQLIIPSAKAPVFSAYVQIPTAITTAQVFICGLGSAFNVTFGSQTIYARFRLNASMALLVDTKDGTTTADGTATGLTLTAGTWYRLGIDMTNLGKIRFWVDDNMVAEVSSGAFGTVSPGLFQPQVAIQKASGVTTPSFLLDWIRAWWSRI